MIRNRHVMKIRVPLLLLAALAGNGSAQTAPPPPIVVGIPAPVGQKARSADVSEFQPAVAAVDSGGRCAESPSNPGMTSGQRGYLYVFDTEGKRTRSVHVVVDSLNQLVTYSDGRGHLERTNAEMMSNAPPAGVMTTLTANVVQGYAMLQNRGPGITEAPLRVPAATFFDAPSLGVPRRMIEHVLRECASGK